MAATALVIRSISVEATWPIRQQVLRPGQPVDTTRYPADQMPAAWHAGAFLGDDLIGVASIYREPPPGSADPQPGGCAAWRCCLSTRGAATARPWCAPASTTCAGRAVSSCGATGG